MPYMLEQPQLPEYCPYVFYKNALSPEECGTLIKMADDLQMGEAQISGDAKVSHETRRTEVGWLHWGQDVDWLYARLAKVCDDVRRSWYPFSLTGFKEPIQLTHYRARDDGGVNDHYTMHRDMGNGAMSNRKLSMVVQLSDSAEFEGGEFNMLAIPGDKKTVPETGQGNLIAFPSWEMHSVSPVTRGERWSLVAWVHGPPFI